MNLKRFIAIFGVIILTVVMVFTWGCQNQPTGPEGTSAVAPDKTRSYASGSCTAGSFSVSYSNANFVTGLGWSSGSSSRTIRWSGSCSSCNYLGVYGWAPYPSIEYYVGNCGGSGSNMGTVSSDGCTYTIWKDQVRSDFVQFKSCGCTAHTVTFANHVNAWRNKGMNLGSHGYQVVSVESWSSRSGSASVSVSGSNWYTHWVNSGSATFTCGGGGGGSTTTTTSGGGGGSCTMTLRARSTDGAGKLRLIVGGKTCGDWTFGTSMSSKSVTLWSSKGSTRVEFYNDASGRDCQVDYLQVCGSTRQAESQSTNTAVWQNGSCGGSNSEWMHCNGYIDFGNTSY